MCCKYDDYIWIKDPGEAIDNNLIGVENLISMLNLVAYEPIMLYI